MALVYLSAGFVAVLCAWALVDSLLEIAREIRYWRVRRERDAAPPLPPLPSTRPAVLHRAELDRPAMPTVRPTDNRDPRADRARTFRMGLAERGQYVSELDIERRLN